VTRAGNPHRPIAFGGPADGGCHILRGNRPLERSR
jgi:hypothetical protein